MSARDMLRDWVPPALRRLGSRLLGAEQVYLGPYADWATATSAAHGYQEAGILARVAAVTEDVLLGKADYEQDGMAMHGVPAPAHALSALLLAASLDQGRLSVLDFGGGLASHYLRWRNWFAMLPALSWCVVEQPHFVLKGNALFKENDTVAFSSSIHEAAARKPNAVLASSVLQYLRDPLDTLEALVMLKPRLIVIDRTPFSLHAEGRILTQHVPRRLGAASYPLWALSRESVHSALRPGYELLVEFACTDSGIRVGGVAANYAGCVWLRRD